jgi:hypothetical protein
MLKGEITPNLMNWSMIQLEWLALCVSLYLYDPMLILRFPQSMKKDLKVPAKIIQPP